MNSLNNQVRKLDLFGHPIVLTYQKEGQQYKTLIGGWISLFIRAAVIAYVIIVFIRLGTYGDTREMITYTHQEFHVNEGEPIDYKTWNDSEMTIFLTVKKAMSDRDSINYQEFYKYLTITVGQVATLYRGTKIYRNETKTVPLVPCTQEMFGSSEYS